jgi:P4 family phage/plasmid primase-like protien
MDTINALGGMLDIPQWFVWRLTWDAEENKFQKMPCYPDGSKYRMNAQDPSNWQTFAAARTTLQHLRTLNDGFAYTLGFWLTVDTGYWFFDIDKCVTNGQLTPLAQQLTTGFTGAAWEWSSSGRGLHVFGRGRVPAHRRKDIHKANLEFYTHDRGVAFGLSGQFFGSAEGDYTPQVEWLVANYFPPQAMPGEVLDTEFDKPCAGWNGPLDDAELIARMRRAERLDAAAVFAGQPAQHATFSDLFDNNREVLQRCYAGASDADFALIGILSFWTGRDAVRTERIMRASSLYREKWDSRRGQDTYIRYSILRQFRASHADNREVYGQQRVTRSTLPNVQGSGSHVDGQFSTDQHSGNGNVEVSRGSTAPVSGEPGTPSLITVTTADPSRKACIDQHRSAFNAATDSTELETAAALAQADPRMTADLAESLAHDLHRRFDEIQVKKKITWCRAILRPASLAIQPGQHRECTEFGNVQRMLDRFGQSLMFVDETEQWFRWDDTRWTAITPRAVAFLAGETIRGIFAEARDEENEDVRGNLMAWAHDSQKNNMVRNMVNLAQSEPQVYARSSTLDADSNLMGAQNCIIDLRTGAALPPDRNARITQYVAVDYTPGADCPWFKQTVREAFFDDLQMVTFFKRLMGYVLLANPKESVLIIPYGHGANGKSTIINAISRIMGTYAKTASADTFTSVDGQRGSAGGGPREDLVRLKGARMLTISEVDENAHLKEAIVKSLTGDDTIIARGVNAKQSIEYRPTFVPIMPTNHRPIIKGDDNGIWRRIMMVPFERNFREDPNIAEDRDRPAKIAGELSGVLNWLVEGALEYQRVGLMRPAAIEAAHNDYRDDMDLLKDWIDTRLEFIPDCAVSANDLFMSWQQYATPKGMLRMIGTATALTRKLTGRKGFNKAQHKFGVKGRCWVGVRLKTAAEITFGEQR